jgi:hypothetical protein
MTDPDGPAAGALSRAVRHAGRLLCWSLAAGMTTAAVDVTAAPEIAWWHLVWPLPWYLTCLSALAWALLRAREKGYGNPPTGEDEPESEWERAA